MINEIVYISFCHTKSLKSCAYLTLKTTSQIRLTIFQVPSSHVRLAATVLDGIALASPVWEASVMVSTAGCCPVLFWKCAALDHGPGSAGTARSAHRCQTCNPSPGPTAFWPPRSCQLHFLRFSCPICKMQEEIPTSKLAGRTQLNQARESML